MPTVSQPGGDLGALVRELDWAATPLGAPATWPQGLRSTLSLCLDSAFPIAIYWGPERVLLYNDAWRPILGDKHPWGLGRPAKDVWPSRWDLAAGGVAAVGESWEDGARRELLEELGIEADLRFLGLGAYADDDVDEVAAVFVARHDGDVEFSDGEVVAARWVTWPELQDILATEPFCPDSVALVLPRVTGLMTGADPSPG